MSPLDPQEFGGESFLQVPLPHYERECLMVTIGLIVSFVFWFVIYPLLVSHEVETTTVTTAEAAKTTTTQPPSTLKKRSKTSKASSSSTSDTATTPNASSATSTSTATAVHREVSFVANVLGMMGALTTAVVLILYGSPYNYFSSRRVFTFPLFTPQECQTIIEMSHQAASLNFQAAQTWANSTQETTAVNPDMMEAETLEESYRTFLQEPHGWHKLRHGNYPTTDLNLVTDPFSKTNRTYLTRLLEQRLAPTLQRLYGIPAGAFRAIDMFVVRYDAGIRTHLERHTDDGDVSFTILLNDPQEFTGGGTRFWRRTPYDQPFAHVEPTRAGTVLTNHALINHEGYHVQDGTRMILVGFTSVDRMDPWTMEPTGLSWYASWWNLGWLNVKFKSGYYTNLERLKRHHGQVETWWDSQLARLLFRDLCNLMEYLGDTLSLHQVEHLVSDENADAFLHALDDAYHQKQQEQSDSGENDKNQVNWWKGQMVNLDFTGKVDSIWNPRAENSNRFSEL